MKARGIDRNTTLESFLPTQKQPGDNPTLNEGLKGLRFFDNDATGLKEDVGTSGRQSAEHVPTQTLSQKAMDDSGRRRLHGAFTGGFSAGQVHKFCVVL